MVRATLSKQILLALLVAMSSSACGSSSDAPKDQVVPGEPLTVGSTGGLAVGTVRLDGAQIVRGKNVFLVAFDPVRTEISGASTLMPVHGHGSVTPTVAREGDGYRLSDVIFNMPGLWEVRLDLAVAGKADHLVFNADVP